MNRREFISGVVAAGSAAALASCYGGQKGRPFSGSKSEGSMSSHVFPGIQEKVSLLGFGCMRFPKLNDAGGKNAPLDQEAINRLINRAIEGGVTYFDTSPAYCGGQSESCLGAALACHPREKYQIATKLSNFDKSTWSREASIKMFEDSFRNLRTDYVDYYLLHAVGNGGMENLNARYIDNGILDFLLEQRHLGRIRHLGFSYHGDVKVFDHLLDNQRKYKWDFVQIQMNYVDWNHAKLINPRNTDASYLYGRLVELGIPAVIMEPLLGGRLSDAPDSIADSMLSRNPRGSIASWGFRFCGSYPGVLTVLSGMSRMEHLEDNLSTFSPLVPLSEEEQSFLEGIAQRLAKYPVIPCNDCGYCVPCPYGIDIPGNFRHYNKCVQEGLVGVDRMDPEYRRARRRYLHGYARELDPGRQADKCIGCGKCRPKCPQRIDIPGQLAVIDRYVEKLRTACVALLVSLCCCMFPSCVRTQYDAVQERLESMTLREKVGQMFVIPPEYLNEENELVVPVPVKSLSDSMRRNYADCPCGGFCLFAPNFDDSLGLGQFTSDLHSLPDHPLIFIDEEGGRVARIAGNRNFDVPRYSDMGFMDAGEIEKAAHNIGIYLKRFGIDVDLAPVADVNTNPSNPVIGSRAFSSDPSEAAVMVADYVKGLHNAGIAACLKHFPGHGDTSTDTHKGYAETLKSWEQIDSVEMVPFKAGIQAGARFVMVAHISLPNVTEEPCPATLSRMIITDKLKGELGFEGIVITDSMRMNAVSGEFSADSAAVKAVLAGTDIILMPQHYRMAFSAVLKAVNDGVISTERIDESVRKILALKSELMDARQ